MEIASEELARFSDLIGLIYEGATDPGRWTHDIMPAIALVLPGSGLPSVHPAAYRTRWRLLVYVWPNAGTV